MNTGKWYSLKNNINIGFKPFTTIKERVIVELTNRQAGMQASVHSSEVKQAGAKLMYSTRRHHVRLGYRSRYSKRIRRSERMNVVLLRGAKPRSRRNYARTELAVKR